MKKFFIILLCIANLSGNFCFSNQNNLPLNEIILENFFRYLFNNTTAGYVVFGERPVYLSTLTDPFEEIPGTDDHELSISMWAGINIWESVYINPANIVLKESDPAYENGTGHEFLIINKKAFLSNVNQNITLFHSKLGLELTSQEILQYLLNPKYNLTSLFKTQHTLLGIIFGYGTHNSMIYERGASLINNANVEAIFPFLEKPFPQNENELIEDIQYSVGKPSLGYNSIKEEFEAISKSLAKPCSNLDGTHTIIPFSYIEKSSESVDLLQSYKKSQVAINKILSSDKFLEVVLNKFGVNAPIIGLPENQKVSSDLLARSIWEFYLNIFPEETLDFHAFLEGMKNAEKGNALENLADFELMDAIRRRRLLFSEGKSRYKLAKESLNALSGQKDIQKLDEKLFFRTIKLNPTEKKVSSATDIINAYILVEDLEDKVLQSSSYLKPPENFKLSELVIGVVHGIQGMCIGETREIWIHPDYIYGIDSDFAHGNVIKMTVHLVDLHDSTGNIPVLMPYDAKLFQISSNEWKSLLKNYHEYCGFMTWNFLMKDRSYRFFDITQSLMKLRKQQENISLNPTEKKELIRLFWKIYYQKSLHSPI